MNFANCQSGYQLQSQEIGLVVCDCTECIGVVNYVLDIENVLGGTLSGSML